MVGQQSGFFRYLIVLCLLAFRASASHAAWGSDGAPVCVAANRQDFVKVVPDANGGFFVTWGDLRLGQPNWDIFAQRMTAAGNPLWTIDGVSVCTAASIQSAPEIVNDGSGGVIIAWEDFRSGVSYDIYAQRLNAAGIPQWTANGVGVCTTNGDQREPQIVSDGSGGVIVTWEDPRFGLSDYDVFAQRLNASGAPQWAVNGIFVSGATGNQLDPEVVSDGAGGAIVTWADSRSGSHDVYAQRVSFLGVAQWAINGVAVCTAVSDQTRPSLVGDGSGGAIIAWRDARAFVTDIYAQRMNAGGSALWVSDGVLASSPAGYQEFPVLATDGSGGAIICFSSDQSGDYDIYAQRLDAVGSPRWAPFGVVVSAVVAYQTNPQIVSDGLGGAVVTWTDNRGGPNLYAQRLSTAGVTQWATNGVVVGTQTLTSVGPIAAGNGSFIVAWDDSRGGGGGSNDNIFAQRIEGRYGEWGIPEPTIVSVEDNPADEGGVIALNWDASQRDALNQRVIAYYSVWRAVDSQQASVVAAAASGTLASRDIPANFQGPGLYVEHTPTTTYYWEWVGSQTARYTPAYSMLVATRQDAVVNEPALHSFQVLAHTFDQYTFWESNVMSGASVDNLAPVAPFLLTAQRAGADVHLHWNRAIAPDLRDYAIYRATSSGVTPAPINFLASADDTVAVDPNAPSSALYYIVTAYDVHANQSDPSNEAHVGALTSIGNLPSITALTVLQNHPNPFTTGTAFDIGLPEKSEITIDVFDVAGRRVSTSSVDGAKGWQRIPFAARDDRGRHLASGVYFYRVRAAGVSVTKKMVIAR